MTDSAALSLTEHMLLARVARGFYLDERSKSELAAELGVSRFRIARLLDEARRVGIVDIRVQSPLGFDADLSLSLQERFGLEHALVIDSDDDQPEELRRNLGRVTAELLTGVVTRGDVIGLAWARSLRAIGDTAPQLPPCPVVQLTGAISGPDGSDVLELVRRVAKSSGGSAHVFYAPLVTPDASSARMLLRQPEVARAFDLTTRVSVAAVGIGAWQPGLSTIFDVVEPRDRDRASALGAVGEISGVLIDAAGAPVTTPLARRIIGVDGAQLRRIRTVIAVAYGARKADAVRAALAGGLVNGLVTHSALARALLSGEPCVDAPSPARRRTKVAADAG
ncbi:sugar-binding transcriptional regulator [Jatrophihabitans endophyticus]|uniref:sugar-binding transcriptional regulator n=1 Tax=Jatrophihabitans endophyticus TaxID=1206085 RepID=UPI001A0ABD61|nr:sugar-binding domain-containing protein [Jatrophihabitans endophyticus]MBE7188291.1 transcriptional regulator [Jatrophihabitans endophyticus]